MKHFKNLFLFFVFFAFTCSIWAKTVVISDIDDTLKQSNSMGKPFEQAYHFLKKVPYLNMRDLFIEIKKDAINRGDGIGFYYVSAAYSITFKADKWIDKYHFPQGRTVLKNLKNKIPTYEFKYNVIKQILEQELRNLDSENGEQIIVYMFGDNAQVDAQVYSDIKKELLLTEAQIYIRDVRAEATYFDSSVPVVKSTESTYYFSEVELFNDSKMNFISNDLKQRALMDYHQYKLIPKYTLKTLERRLSKLYADLETAHNDAHKFWEDYHHRY